MIRRLVLIRHGKTKGNLEGRYIGLRTDEPLCKEGIEELILMKDKYESLNNIRQLFLSPMKRAVETADIIFKADNVKLMEELKEIDFGIFENKNYKELSSVPEYQAWIDSNGKSDYPGGEGLAHFINRSMTAFNKILSDMNTEAIDEAAVICHGGNIMAIMSTLTGKEYFDFMTENGSGYILDLEVKDNKIDLVSFSCF